MIDGNTGKSVNQICVRAVCVHYLKLHEHEAYFILLS